MHIIENFNGKMGYKYCYANVCYWNKDTKKYVNDRTPIGKLIGEPPSFVPNKPFLRMLGEDSSTSSERVKAIIAAAVKKYGDEILELGNVEPSLPKGTLNCQTATSSFVGPAIVFGGITKRYGIDALLHQAFGLNDGNDILALAWYMASEGSALSNSDQWLCYYDNPRGSSLSSQEITGLLDRMNTDGVMTFYKGWLANFERLNNLANTKDHVLYDLTSISYSGKNIALSNWGRIRDSEDLPQVNLALLCARNTSMPLFSWPLEGSISDIKTLKNTLEFLANLGYKPDCLMMDRGFSSMDNISYLFQHDIVFLQAVRVNSNWIRNVIDAGRINRLSPDSKLVVDNRSYYCSTTHCHWVAVKKETRKGFVEDVIVTIPDGSIKSKTYIPLEKNFKIVSQHKCMVHVLFCQDLVGKQWDRFMDDLKVEHDRLVS
ncbi:MAG: hypothetical protein LBO05_00160, partial [Deltaproteobacteria bacterium]|nr:hypothetical protein [Deltaproteobacteria bacterium]